MEVLSFLDPIIKEASTDSNMDFLEQVEEGVCPSNMDDQGQESRNDVTDQSSVIQSPSPSLRETPPNSVYVEESTFKNPTESRRPKKTKKCTASMTEFETSFLAIAKAQASRLNTLEYEQPKRDAVDAFYESCALRTKQLPKNKQLWLQMQVSMLLYTSETSDSLPPFMPYPCQTHHSYPHQQAYNSNQLPIPEYINQQGSGLSDIAYNKNDFSAGNENSSQITHTTGLDILSVAMQSLE